MTDKTADDDILTRVRDFPECETPEDTMRELLFGGVASSHRSIDSALQYLVDIMEEDGPFDAVIGYSEGATVAATLLLHDQRRSEAKGVPAMFKYAIFFGGWPPVDPETHAMILSDMSEIRIEIPTCHISKYRMARFRPVDVFFRLRLLTAVLVGSQDPYHHGSLALFNVCNPETAYLFDHAKQRLQFKESSQDRGWRQNV